MHDADTPRNLEPPTPPAKRRRRVPGKKTKPKLSAAEPGETTTARPTLFNDARNALRKLKGKHHDLYQRDREGFKATIRKALTRVCGVKPGPKDDIRIVEAARERAAGAEWPALYLKHIEWYDRMPESTRIWAELGFKRKVNAYIAKTPRLRALRKKSFQKLRPQLPAA